MKSFFFLLLAVMSTHAYAACGTVDLSDSPGYREKHQTQQGNIGWCYAYSLADIVSQKLAAPVSPLDIAFRYNEYVGRTDRNSLATGGIFWIANGMFHAQPGFCLESNYLNDMIGAERSDAVFAEAAIFRALKDILAKSDPEQKANRIRTSVWSTFFFKNTQPSDAFQAAEQANTEAQFLSNLNSANCIDRNPNAVDLDVRWQSCGPDNWDCQVSAQAYIQDSLDHGKMVSIGIDAFGLFNYASQSAWDRFQGSAFGNHAVTLVGKTQRDDNCYYKVHDSAIGSEYECLNYRKSADTLCHSDGTYEISEDQLGEVLRFSATVKN